MKKPGCLTLKAAAVSYSLTARRKKETKV